MSVVGQTAHAGRRPRLVRLTAAAGVVVLAGTLLSACAPPARDVATLVQSASGALLVAPTGTSSEARSGELVKPGDWVVTGPAGRAVLDTGGRLVWLAARTKLRVSNGTAEQVAFGSILIDARSGPNLTVRSGDLAIDPAAGSAVRVQVSFDTRVGAVLGSVTVSGPGGGREVPALHQLLATALALPAGDLPPLQLTDDRAEKSVAPELVASDEYLNAEAAEIDSGALGNGNLQLAAARWLPAAFHPLVDSQASEAVLPLLIAQAAGGRVGLAGRYTAALRLRQQGGSWGVVAALVGARALRTTGGLQQLLLAAATRPVTTPTGRGGTGAASTPAPARPIGSPIPVMSPAPTRSPAPQGSQGPAQPSPSSSPSPPQSLLDTIASLLPTLPAATPAASGGNAVSTLGARLSRRR